MNLVLVTVLAALQLSVFVEAVSHVHRGPASAQVPAVTLHGTVVVDKSDGIGSPADFKLIPWSAQILRDVVLWYELEKDVTEITDCSSDVVTLRGAKLNQSDYAIGTVFIIGDDDWGSRCPPVAPDPEIDPDDQVLFYSIESTPTIGVDGSITLAVKRITGADVIPEVRLRVSPNEAVPAPRSQVGDTEILPDGALSTTIRQDVFLQTSDRFRVGHTYTITHKVKLSWELQANLHIDEFRWVRKKIGFWRWKKYVKIGMEWEQRYDISANAKLRSTAGSFDFKKSIGILRPTAIPGFGFSGKLPLIGHYSAGASVKLEALIEIKSKSTFEVKGEAHYGERHRARVVPFKLEVHKLGRTQSGISGEMHFDHELHGFLGLRPTIMVGVTAKRKTLVGVDASVKLGVEVESDTKFDPHFLPYSGPGFEIGVCNECHHIRAFLDGVIKDPKLRGLVWNKVVYKKTFDWRYSRRLGTLCAWESDKYCYA